MLNSPKKTKLKKKIKISKIQKNTQKHTQKQKENVLKEKRESEWDREKIRENRDNEFRVKNKLFFDININLFLFFVYRTYTAQLVVVGDNKSGKSNFIINTLVNIHSSLFKMTNKILFYFI